MRDTLAEREGVRVGRARSPPDREATRNVILIVFNELRRRCCPENALQMLLNWKLMTSIWVIKVLRTELFSTRFLACCHRAMDSPVLLFEEHDDPFRDVEVMSIGD